MKWKIYLIKRTDPKSLAEAIIRLKNDEYLITRIKENGFKMFNTFLSTNKIGMRLRSIMDGILRNRNQT